MADALASGASARKGVGVQVPPRAPRSARMGRALLGAAVELSEVMARYAMALAHIDATVEETRTNQRTGRTFLPSVRSLTEPQVVEAVDAWWGGA